MPTKDLTRTIALLRRQIEIAVRALQRVATDDDRSGVVDALKAIEVIGRGEIQE
jgi:hypothetical protein